MSKKSSAARMKRQEKLEGRYIKLMKELGPLWGKSGRTTNTPTGRKCFAVHLRQQVTNAIEMLPVRRNPKTGVVELLMFPRSRKVGPGNPEKYAGRDHSPGCMQMWRMNPRAGLNRVVAKETGVPYRIIGSLAPNPDIKRSPRGWEMPICYIVHLQGNLPANSTGVWVALTKLPRLYRQDKIIRAQYEDFLKDLVDWTRANTHKIA